MLDEIYFVGIALKEEDTLCQEPFSFFLYIVFIITCTYAMGNKRELCEDNRGVNRAGFLRATGLV